MKTFELLAVKERMYVYPISYESQLVFAEVLMGTKP